MITYIEGDLFTCGIKALAHGCNCQGVMGAGIAAQFRARFPAMYERYRNLCADGWFIPGEVMPWTEQDRVVFNLATQARPGLDAQPWMIAAAVGRMIMYGVRHRITEIAMPWIGTGIGGLSPGRLMRTIEPYENAPVNLTVVTWRGP